LESDGGSAGHGSCSPTRPDETSDSLSFDLQRDNRRADSAEGTGEEQDSKDCHLRWQFQAGHAETDGSRLAAARRRGDREEMYEIVFMFSVEMRLLTFSWFHL